MRFGTPQTEDRPCNGCTDRHVGCHGNCEREAAWLAEQKPVKERATAEKQRDREINVFRRNQIWKVKKRRRAK